MDNTHTPETKKSSVLVFLQASLREAVYSLRRYDNIFSTVPRNISNGFWISCLMIVLKTIRVAAVDI